jgi:hypothetical protein
MYADSRREALSARDEVFISARIGGSLLVLSPPRSITMDKTLGGFYLFRR